MQFRILGPIQAVLDDEPAALGAPKQRGLLALLLVNRRRVVTAEQLIDGLWGEAPPASAVQSLQVYVHGLRRALGAERIETAGRGYRVVVGEDELDLDRFERTLERGRAALEAGRPDDAADDLREALAVWRGPALADLPEEIRRAAEAERLEELRFSALELRYDAELACGRHDAVVAELEAVTAEHPYRERFLQQRMLALYRCDRQAEALEVYRAAREVLAEDLGLDPSPVLQELERAILRQDPSLAAPEAPTRSTRPLPVPPTPLVGRRLELAAVSALFRDEGARLVTLTGPGGTGKTRLGLAVAHELEPELRDGALFVSLAPVSDPELLVPTIAEALDVREGGRNLAEGVIEHLGERRMLLVLDNFEQILPAAPFVGELLAAAPRLWILATSRAPLRLAAEREYPVPPFDAPDAGLPFESLVKADAVRLFAARAQAVDPGFELDTGSAPEVAQVCRRLDGLPLAIELAAARAKLLAPGEILERLEREPNMLPAGPRDAPARQQTLAATIHWSFDLLGPEERQAFVRLGVFVGGCTLEAAEGVCDVTLESLGRLVDNNLLRRRDGRFMMLETVRHFAVEQLEEAGADEVCRRHAEWLTELAETFAERTLAGEDMTMWLDRIQPEHDNIRAALAWSLEHEPELTLRQASSFRLFWEVRGNFREGPPVDRGRASVRGRDDAEGAVQGPGRKRSHRYPPRQPRSRAGAQGSGSGAGARARRRALGSRASSATSARSRRCARSTTSPARCSRRALPCSASSTCRPGWGRCSPTSATSPASEATTTSRSSTPKRRWPSNRATSRTRPSRATTSASTTSRPAISSRRATGSNAPSLSPSSSASRR